MKRAAKVKRDGRSQAERFEAAAREHGADEDEKRWERLKKVAKQKRNGKNA
jgi:hypothetical protein